jgi:hypothetical protein
MGQRTKNMKGEGIKKSKNEEEMAGTSGRGAVPAIEKMISLYIPHSSRSV